MLREETAGDLGCLMNQDQRGMVLAWKVSLRAVPRGLRDGVAISPDGEPLIPLTPLKSPL